jgi:hypothetical protein
MGGALLSWRCWCLPSCVLVVCGQQLRRGLEDDRREAMDKLGRGSRERKQISYADDMTELEFLRVHRSALDSPAPTMYFCPWRSSAHATAPRRWRTESWSKPARKPQLAAVESAVRPSSALSLCPLVLSAVCDSYASALRMVVTLAAADEAGGAGSTAASEPSEDEEELDGTVVSPF